MALRGAQAEGRVMAFMSDEMAEVMRASDMYERNVIFHGPVASGKSIFARMVADELRMRGREVQIIEETYAVAPVRPEFVFPTDAHLIVCVQDVEKVYEDVMKQMGIAVECIRTRTGGHRWEAHRVSPTCTSRSRGRGYVMAKDEQYVVKVLQVANAAMRLALAAVEVRKYRPETLRELDDAVHMCVFYSREAVEADNYRLARIWGEACNETAERVDSLVAQHVGDRR